MNNSNNFEQRPFCPKMLKPRIVGKTKHISSAHPREFKQWAREQKSAKEAGSQPTEVRPMSILGTTQSHLEQARHDLRNRRAVLAARISEIEALQAEDRILYREEGVLDQALAALTLSEGSSHAPEEHPTPLIAHQSSPRSHARANGPA